MIDQNLIQRAEQALSKACGLPFEKLLGPIEGVPGAGRAASNGSIADAIRRSRVADGASLPMGALQLELRRADWDKVMHISCDALVRHGKDLQLAAWLLEAQIHRRGFAAIAGSLYLMARLCEQYWDDIHPQSDDGTHGRRANIFTWINRKLALILRQVPLAFDRQGQPYVLADWERVRRHEQLRQTGSDDIAEGPSGADLSAALSALVGDTCADAERDLIDALAMLKHLSEMLDPRMGEEAPSLNLFAATMEQARGLFAAELQRRGLPRHAPPSAIPVEPVMPAANVEKTAPPVAATLPETAMAEPAGIRDRAEAYALLEQAASFLQHDDPHSPVPYLVRRAAQWGKLDAAELYQELFLRRNGQIHIFDVMGLDIPVQADNKD